MKTNIKLMGSFLLAVILQLSISITALSYDYFGNDIASLNVNDANQCAAACNANPNCLAWTFVTKGRLSPSARCFLKNPVPAPSFNSTCPSNNECKSGLKRADCWCGETELRFVQGSQILGQGEVLTCSQPQSCPSSGCGAILLPAKTELCWFFIFPYPCHGKRLQTTEFFCR
jgi:hypothetical protein